MQHIISQVEQQFTQAKHPDFSVGDTIEVSLIIREGGKQRIQKFAGLVIAIKGSGTRKMFTVRKISYGVGVEKALPLFSPNIKEIKILKTGKTRRSKLYFIRKRVGKLALKVKAGDPIVVIEGKTEEPAEEAAPQVVAAEESTSAEVEQG